MWRQHETDRRENAVTPIVRQIQEMQSKSFAELKQLWRDYYQAEPPPYKRGFMLHALACRIQELTYGGLNKETADRLDELIGEADGRKARKRSLPVEMPVTGTRLIREWKGKRYEVVVLVDGFEYAGRPWRSLSAIAQKITGTHWNGLNFFGLRKKKEKPA